MCSDSPNINVKKSFAGRLDSNVSDNRVEDSRVLVQLTHEMNWPRRWSAFDVPLCHIHNSSSAVVFFFL